MRSIPFLISLLAVGCAGAPTRPGPVVQAQRGQHVTVSESVGDGRVEDSDLALRILGSDDIATIGAHCSDWRARSLHIDLSGLSMAEMGELIRCLPRPKSLVVENASADQIGLLVGAPWMHDVENLTLHLVATAPDLEWGRMKKLESFTYEPLLTGDWSASDLPEVSEFSSLTYLDVYLYSRVSPNTEHALDEFLAPDVVRRVRTLKVESILPLSGPAFCDAIAQNSQVEVIALRVEIRGDCTIAEGSRSHESLRILELDVSRAASEAFLRLAGPSLDSLRMLRADGELVREIVRQPWFEHLSEFSGAGREIDDELLSVLIANNSSLKALTLRGTSITKSGLRSLSSSRLAQTLETLEVSTTALSKGTLDNAPVEWPRLKRVRWTDERGFATDGELEGYWKKALAD